MIKNNNFFKLIFIFFYFSLVTILPIYSNAHISTQSHQNDVSMIVATTDDSFFSAGKDGFIIKWTPDGLGEHYQLTELEIRLIAAHPNGKEISVYETDGYSIHRISVWDWETLTRKFVRNFSNSITALSYTAKGTLLSVGTTTVKGVIYLNPYTGREVPKLKDSTGIVNMIIGSSSEKSSVMYSPTGHITYYDMINGTRKQRFNTEVQLEQTFLFNNNLFLAGIKNNTIYVVDALSGNTVTKIPATSPILVKDSKDTNLYYIENSGRNNILKSISVAHTEEGKILADKPKIIKTFSGISNNNNITYCTKIAEKTIIGSKKGNIYSIETIYDSSVTDAISLTDNMYEKVLDIATVKDEFYCLTPKTIFKTSYDTGIVDTVGTNSGFTEILSHEDSLILWTKNSKNIVSKLDLSTGEITNLFKPTNFIQNLRIFNDSIVYIEGNTTVKIYDFTTKHSRELYSGTGIQDVVLYNDTELFVAKSAASNPRSPLINVNTKTKETVMLPITGNVAFSLSYDGSTNLIYGIQVLSDTEDSNTIIFSYNPTQKKAMSIMKVSEEDTNAFLSQKGSTLYTNIGKNQIRSYDTVNRKQIVMKRSSSLPLKLEKAKNRIAVLNRDGSISWYTAGNGNVLADWYMTIDGMWFEF